VQSATGLNTGKNTHEFVKISDFESKANESKCRMTKPE
jgi:hypothetical protein